MTQAEPQTALQGPLMRMARFFLGETLPELTGAPDVYRWAKEIKDARLPIRKGEEILITKILFCILQVQHDQEETEQHQALCGLAALVLAIIEDDDFFVPEAAAADISRPDLELLAVQIQRQQYQLNMSLGATIGLYDLKLSSSSDLVEVRPRLPPQLLTPEVESVLNKLQVHLAQGEAIFAKHTDPERRERHRLRLEKAYVRGSFLLARLLGVPAQADHPVVRAHIVRREHRHVEIDALGAERISEDEQERQTRKLLEWTEEEMGETLTDENKAELALKLQAAAESSNLDLGADESGSWFFGME